MGWGGGVSQPDASLCVVCRREHPGERTRTRVRPSRRRSEAPQEFASHFAIVEWKRPVAELLPLLVTLAGDHDHVPLPREVERACDRSPPLHLDLEIGGALDD